MSFHCSIRAKVGAATASSGPNSGIFGQSLELEGSLRLAGKGSKKSTGKKPSFSLVNDDNLPQIYKKSRHFSQVTRV